MGCIKTYQNHPRMAGVFLGFPTSIFLNSRWHSTNMWSTWAKNGDIPSQRREPKMVTYPLSDFLVWNTCTVGFGPRRFQFRSHVLCLAQPSSPTTWNLWPTLDQNTEHMWKPPGKWVCDRTNHHVSTHGQKLPYVKLSSNLIITWDILVSTSEDPWLTKLLLTPQVFAFFSLLRLVVSNIFYFPQFMG